MKRNLLPLLLAVSGTLFLTGCQSAVNSSCGFKRYICYRDYQSAAQRLRRGFETETGAEPRWRALTALALAKSEEQLGNKEKMLEAYRASFAAKELPEARYWLGYYQLAHGEREEALQNLAKALALVESEIAEWKKLPPEERFIGSLSQSRGYDTFRILLRGNLFRQTNITRLRAEDFYELLRLSIRDKLHEAEQ